MENNMQDIGTDIGTDAGTAVGQDAGQDAGKEFTVFGVTVPKFDFTKFDLTRFDFTKFEFTNLDLAKLDLTKISNVTEAVKNVAVDTVQTTSQAAAQVATKARKNAAYTVTLVREAVGV